MPPMSNKRKKQLLSVRRAQEGAKRARERMKAEKAREEAEQSQYLAEGGGSAGHNQPRGSEPEGPVTFNGKLEEPPAVNEIGITPIVQEAEVPLGRLRTRRQRVRAQ